MVITPKIYVAEGTIYVWDLLEKHSGNEFTPAHGAQGFARRPSCANILTPFPEDGFVTQIESDRDGLAKCSRIVSLSIDSPSGEVFLGGFEPGGHTIWRGRPGWVRLTIGQRIVSDGEWPDLCVVVVGEETEAEAPSQVWRDGVEIAGPFVETATRVRLAARDSDP